MDRSEGSFGSHDRQGSVGQGRIQKLMILFYANANLT